MSGNRLLRSTAIFSSMTFLSRLSGLVRDQVYAHVFGAGGMMDAFFVAFRIPNFMRRLSAEGSFSMAFVPVLNELRERLNALEERLRQSTAPFHLAIVGGGIPQAVGLALAGNLVTFLLFYELLTLATFPLVVHRGTAESLAAGRKYLAYTLSGGVILMLGVALLHSLVQSPLFTPGGYVAAVLSGNEGLLMLAFALMITGLGVKAALLPLHGWLPQAMVAPAPVSALLHAVAVVKAGAFGIIRLVYDVFGVESMHALQLAQPLMLLAACTILYGSWRALAQQDIKRRLAYSTISQVSYITLGVAMLGPLAAVGGLVHLVHQGVMKITLFFCAGNFAETLGIHKIRELNGVGRRMPITAMAFTLGALGMIGVPPTAGFISKWYLGLGAAEVEQPWLILVFALSGLMNAAYFLPVIYRMWFLPQSGPWPAEQRLSNRFETHWMLLFPAIFTAVLLVLMGVFAGTELSPLNWAQLIVEREFRHD